MILATGTIHLNGGELMLEAGVMMQVQPCLRSTLTVATARYRQLSHLAYNFHPDCKRMMCGFTGDSDGTYCLSAMWG